MAFVGILLVSFAPGLFWLWFYLRTDVYRPEPRSLIAWTFVLGCLSIIPAVLIEFIFLGESFLEGDTPFGVMAVGMLLVVGPAEEACKFAAVRFKAYRSLYFDEPIDGLVYAAAASLGFASLENLGYVLLFGPEVMIVRAPLSTVAHLVFGSAWGYALGVHRASGYRRPMLVAGSLALAAGAHGVFNILALEFPLGAAAPVIAGGIWAFGRFKRGRHISPFRYRRNYPKTACASCGQLIRALSSFCRFCGASVLSVMGQLFCGHCGQGNRPDADYCTGCGDNLLRA